ncbi:MAG: DEAD/DEAH box helicase, partial [Candidatus Omnitrophica bacterium]|nr:DEAD/DEAH box helicase [Candidatus Omnitrophota bacterium]
MLETKQKRQAEQILKEIFGYKVFRPFQEQCIYSALEKKDTLLVLPTGGGKSLCYQIPAMIFHGITVVISPLISLMQDQVRQLKNWGVPAEMLNSSLSHEEYSSVVAGLKSLQIKIIFMAPETLLKDVTIDMLSHLPVDCLAVDEAHC